MRALRWTLALAIGVVALFYIDWRSVLEQFRLQHVLTILAVQPLQFLGLFLVAWRFALLSDCGTGRLGKVFRAYLLSVGLNTFVPGRLTEILKISYLRDKASIPTASSLAALLLERLLDIVFLGLCVLLGMGALWIDIDPLYLGCAIAILFLGTVFLPRFERSLQMLFSWVPIGSAGALFQRTIAEASARVHERKFILALFLGAMAWGSAFLLVLAVLEMLFGSAVTFHDGFIVFSAMAVGRAIPGLPAGLGTFEAAVILAMQHLGFTFPQALSTALTLHASQLVLVAVVALVILATEGTGLGVLLRDARRAIKYE